jgi:4-hydroxy-3-polyprenylbenzoate decarboxylase
MNLVVALTGASGGWATKRLLEKSQWPVTLVASEMGRVVYEKEAGPFAELEALAAEVWKDTDLTATISSGTVSTAGMVILPCSVNTLGKIAAGVADSLVTRAAHCHLKEGRKVILCIREAPWTSINARNAAAIAAAGGTIMPLSPPYYMVKDRNPDEVSISEMLGFYVDHVLSILGQDPPRTWADIR